MKKSKLRRLEGFMLKCVIFMLPLLVISTVLCISDAETMNTGLTNTWQGWLFLSIAVVLFVFIFIGAINDIFDK